MSHDHHRYSSENVRTAFFLNLLFAVIELFGGFYTNSVAIISDAIHDIGDSLSLGLAWYFQKVSKKSRDHNFSYGYQRFSVLGAIINGLVLTIGSFLIIYEAVPRLYQPEMPDATGMIYLAVLGIVVNGVAAFKMRHGHSLNERVVYLHLLEDVLGWAATLIVAVILSFRAIPILDPLLSLAITAFILYNVFKNLKKSINIILQGTPEEIEPEKIESSITDFEEVLEVHDCHIWTMDGTYHILSIHVVLKEHLQMDQLIVLKQKIKERVKKLNIDHITLEFESPEEQCNPC
jgi:cobalt-zinc-cadmium efflux system protein